MSETKELEEMFLRNRLEKYESEMEMTEGERSALHQWVAEGNDPYCNGCFWYNENGSEMDFISAMRMDETMYDELNAMSEEELEKFMQIKE